MIVIARSGQNGALRGHKFVPLLALLLSACSGAYRVQTIRVSDLPQVREVNIASPAAMAKNFKAPKRTDSGDQLGFGTHHLTAFYSPRTKAIWVQEGLLTPCRLKHETCHAVTGNTPEARKECHRLWKC